MQPALPAHKKTGNKYHVGLLLNLFLVHHYALIIRGYDVSI